MRYWVIDMYELMATLGGATIFFFVLWVVLRKWFFFTPTQQKGFAKILWENKR